MADLIGGITYREMCETIEESGLLKRPSVRFSAFSKFIRRWTRPTFVVNMGAVPDRYGYHTNEQYIAAWESLRTAFAAAPKVTP